MQSRAIFVIEYTASSSPKEDLNAVRAKSKCFVQSFDPCVCPSYDTLKLLLYQTEQASVHHQLLAKSGEVDFLMRLAGSDQIRDAIRIAGAKPRTKSLMLFYGNPTDVEEDSQRALRLLPDAAPFKIPNEAETKAAVSRGEVSALLGLRKLKQGRQK